MLGKIKSVKTKFRINVDAVDLMRVSGVIGKVFIKKLVISNI
jgi:hypothetical protein